MEKIGVTHIGTVTAQGTEEERKAMLRVMGAGLVDDTPVGREIGTIDRAMLQSMATSFRARMDFSFNPNDMANLLERCAACAHTDTQEVERLRAESEGAMMIIAQERAENLNLQARVAELEAALAAQGAVTVKPLWRHVKRGTVYTEIGRGKVQTYTPLTDYAEVVVYRGQEGDTWVRPVGEFEDGRFAALTTAQSNAEGGE